MKDPHLFSGLRLSLTYNLGGMKKHYGQDPMGTDYADRKDMLTIQQFSHRVGAPASEVLKNHQAGYFLAAVVGGKGRGLRRLYAPEQVEQYHQMVKDRVPRATTDSIERIPYTAEQAKTVFCMLKDGKSMADVVIQEGMHPDVALSIGLAWQRVSGSIFVSGETQAKIGRLPLSGPVPIKSESDLYEVLRLAVEENSCLLCKKNTKVACKSCIAVAIGAARADEKEKAQPLSDAGPK